MKHAHRHGRRVGDLRPGCSCSGGPRPGVLVYWHISSDILYEHISIIKHAHRHGRRIGDLGPEGPCPGLGLQAYQK